MTKNTSISPGIAWVNAVGSIIDKSNPDFEVQKLVQDSFYAGTNWHDEDQPGILYKIFAPYLS